VLPVALLLLERAGDQLDPPCSSLYMPPPWSFSSRSARKLHVLQNSSRSVCPRALREYAPNATDVLRESLVNPSATSGVLAAASGEDGGVMMGEDVVR